MRYQELSEAFDNPYEFKWVSMINGFWKATFRAKGNKEYNVTFYKEYDEDNYVRHDGSSVPEVWEVSFHTFNSVDREFGVMGGREDATKIFATVIAVIRAFVEKVQPECFMFNSKSDEVSRNSLYARMDRRLSPSFTNYKKETLVIHPDLAQHETDDEKYNVFAWVRTT